MFARDALSAFLAAADSSDAEFSLEGSFFFSLESTDDSVAEVAAAEVAMVEVAALPAAMSGLSLVSD